MPADAHIVEVLCGVITSLASFIAWMYRDSLRRADERVAALERREDEKLDELGKTLTQVSSTVIAMAEEQKGVTRYVIERQTMERLQGQKRQP